VILSSSRRIFFLGILCLYLFPLRVLAQDSIRSPSRWYKKEGFRILAVPSLLTLYGLSVHGENGWYSSMDVYRDIQLHWPDFYSPIDNYLQFVPAATVYGLHAFGVKGENPLLKATCLYGSSFALSTLFVQGLKHTVPELRPDGSNSYSFPSGHTATAFCAAEFLHQEYGKKSVWYSVAGYTMASLTGVFRMLNNKHWESDVFVGAGIGMFSTKLCYGINRALKKRKPPKKVE